MKIIIAAIVIVAVAAGAVVLVQKLSPPAPEPAAAAAPDTFTTKSGAKLSWQGGAINWSVSQIPPGGRSTKTLYLGPGELSVTVRSTSDEVASALQSPSGKIFSPTEVRRDQGSGDTITTFKLDDNDEGGEWTITTDNDEEDDTTTTIVETDGEPPFDITEETDGGAETGHEVTVSISVYRTKQTAAGPTSVPVSGAEVTAVITDPVGRVTVLPLPEDPAVPGTYGAKFNGNYEPGVYRIEYIIEGVDEDGNDFTQETDGDFIVTDDDDGDDGGTGDGGDDSGTIWHKKYDIDRSGEINIIGH